MELTYAVERFPDIAEEIAPLFFLHWRERTAEQDSLPFDPAWALYAEMDRIGVLVTVAARHKGVLVGYFTMTVQVHMHHAAVRCAFSDLWYLHPAFRSGTAGVRLLKEAEKAAKDAGAERLYVGVPEDLPLAKLMRRRGYGHEESVYVKDMR